MGGPNKVLGKMNAAGFVTVREAAERAGVHTATIYRLIDGGQVEGCRVGRFRFVNVASLAAVYPEPIRGLILAEAS